MGIPDSLLPYLTHHLGRLIGSSRSRVEGTNEFRTVQATKMWDRLVQKGLAEYFAEDDIYRTTEPCAPPSCGPTTASESSAVNEGPPSVS
jgi:hypothetical protein